jgi:crotonobetainyl-CoA:carnitine CoA-transferase CaiB-like acyl-CoA transferase
MAGSTQGGGMQAFGVQVMWRFLTTATMFVILLAGSHASPAVAAKAASPHHYQTFRGKVVAPPYRYFRCKGGRFYAYALGAAFLLRAACDQGFTLPI